MEHFMDPQSITDGLSCDLTALALGVAAVSQLSLENVTFTYPEQSRSVLHGIDLEIDAGEFILLTGLSGSGKSTLLRLFNGLVPYYSGGVFSGAYAFADKRVGKSDVLSLTEHCGLVFQDPEKQLIMTTVEREIAFGLENLGVEQSPLRRQVEEILTFFDLRAFRNKNVWELSSGQMQKVAIASAVAMNPQVLLLDEPTSQLDPVAAEEVLQLVQRLNTELGLTILLVEHRTEKCLYAVDRIVHLKSGVICYDGAPSSFIPWAKDHAPSFCPPVPRLFQASKADAVPLTVKEAKPLLEKATVECTEKDATSLKREGQPIVLSAKKMDYRWPKTGERILDKVDFNLHSGERVGLIGSNGAGKSTLLQLLAGVRQPTRGKVTGEKGFVGYLSQNPNDYLIHDTLQDELFYTQENLGKRDELGVENVLKRLHLYDKRFRHPRDFSSGERQRAALASILSGDPTALLLDEPTRGMDPVLKEELGDWMQTEVTRGKAILVVTHDMEFVARYMDRVILLESGKILSQGRPHDILHGGLFYTTPLNILFRSRNLKVLTRKDIKRMQWDTGGTTYENP